MSGNFLFRVSCFEKSKNPIVTYNPNLPKYCWNIGFGKKGYTCSLNGKSVISPFSSDSTLSYATLNFEPGVSLC